jgi:hypothetical protein
MSPIWGGQRTAVEWFETHVAPLASLLRLSLERVLRALARLREVAVCAVLHRVGITMAQLILHGIIATLGAIVRLLGTFTAVGVIL